MRLSRFGLNICLSVVSLAHVAAAQLMRRPPPALLDEGAILVVRLEATLGDNLLNIPFLRAARAAFPGRQIHLVHHAASAAVYADCPYVDRRIEVNWPMRAGWTLARRLGLAAGLFRPASSRYSYVFQPRWGEDLFGPFVAWMSGASVSLGFSRRVLREKAIRCLGVDALLSRSVLDRTVEHESTRALKLLEDFQALGVDSGRLEFGVSSAATSRVAAAVAGAQARPGLQWIAIATGASLGRRKWPIESFALLARRLGQLADVGFMVVGSAGDRADALLLAAACGPAPVLTFAGNLKLDETAAAIATCSAFVGNDSGLLHLASAVGVPAVELSCHPIGASPLHANAPERFGPTVVGSIVVRPRAPLSPRCHDGCARDTAHCITSIQPDEAIRATMQILSLATAQNERSFT